MRVKICGVRTDADLRAAVKAGADAVGLLVGQVHASPDFILSSTASRLASLLPPYVSPVIVTHLTEPSSIMEIVMQTGVTTVQLHGGSSPEEAALLRDLMPVNGKLILSVNIGPDSHSLDYRDYLKIVDAILLDSCDRVNDRVGGTGLTCDWSQCAQIVKDCPLPVILAGGLKPENVATAIKKVRPFAVDANSGLRGEDGGRSPQLCADFVKNALEAFLAGPDAP